MGLAIALFRGRSPVVLAFAAYAIGNGALGLATVVDAAYTTTRIWWPTLVLGALGFWGLFLFFPRPVPPKRAMPAAAAAAAGLAIGLLYALNLGEAVPLRGDASGLVTGIDVTLETFVSGGIIAVALLLPLRAGWTGADPAEARSLGIVAVGLVAASAGTFSDIARIARGDGPALTGVLNATYVLLPTLLWLRLTLGAHARVARNVVVASATLYLGSVPLGPDVAWAAGQVTGALLLAYAVLRGHIDGLDLKVRFALSRSTVAATFIAAFFIVSEGAQQLFDDALGSAYVGIAAAGALVFALAPLQRAAERLAERAVPVAAPAVAPAPASKGEEAYRRAVRLAWKDRALTREEEVHLFHVADALDVHAGRAMEIKHEVEREARREEVHS